MTRSAKWLALVTDAEIALKRDDDGWSFKARAEATRICDEIGRDRAILEACPDPSLFSLFHYALAAWAGRPDPVKRDRIRGPLVSLCNALSALPGEARRLAQAEAARAPIERQLPSQDR